jgi:hypothetical protein
MWQRLYAAAHFSLKPGLLAEILNSKTAIFSASAY